MKVFLISLLLTATEVPRYPAKFVNCYDGDTCTFNIEISDQTFVSPLGIQNRLITTRLLQTIRLCDINAPEMKPGPNPAAIKARDDLVSWISNANELVIEVPSKDECLTNEYDPKSVICAQYEKYGRLLGYVIADGNNLNQQQLDVKNAVPFILCK